MTEADKHPLIPDNPTDGPPKEGDERPCGEPRPDRPRLVIRIDRREYAVPPELLEDGRLTGLQIRRLADPDIGPDRDLFEVVPGGSDRRIADAQEVPIRNRMRFFSAPSVINPGASPAAGLSSAAAQPSGRLENHSHAAR